MTLSAKVAELRERVTKAQGTSTSFERLAEKYAYILSDALALLSEREADAERYRFLRSADDSWVVEHWLPEPRGASELLDGTQLDDAIDAALAEKGPRQ